MSCKRIVSAATVLAAACAAVFGTAGASHAGDGPGVEVGILTCRSVEGTRLNLIFHSSVDLDCVFETPQGSERYVGESGVGLGLDINWERTEEIRFAVISTTTESGIGDHSLAGKYVGGKASITAGRGVGAQGLVGVGPKSFSLQPLAIETSEGFGLAAGLAYLFLEAPATEGASPTN